MILSRRPVTRYLFTLPPSGKLKSRVDRQTVITDNETMHFQAPREIIEHPALLVEALQAHAIPVELCDSPFRIFGMVDEMEVWLGVRPKRFRANLSLIIAPSRATLERETERLDKLLSAAADERKEEGDA